MTNSDRQLAIVYATIAQMNCEVAGMIAQNVYRQLTDNQVSYDEESFMGVWNKYEPVIGYNAIASIPVD